MSVFVMGDLDLAIRGRTYREPEGPHSMVVRGRDLDAALQHIIARSDCRSVAVVALPEQVPDLITLRGDPTNGFLPIFYLPPGQVVTGVGVALLVGVIAGFLPAFSAMRLRVVEALRRV